MTQDEILDRICELEDGIHESQEEIKTLLNTLVPIVAKYKAGDQIEYRKGKKLVRAEIFSRNAIWCPETRSVVVEYEIRKLLKSGGLHAQINKVRNTSGWSPYECQRRNTGIAIESA